MRIWSALGGGQTAAKKMQKVLLGSVALPGAIAVANRLGIGRFSTDLSLKEISRATAAAMARRSSDWNRGGHVIFGHTHRRGPLPGEEPWKAKTGANLHNTGSWVYSPGLLGAQRRAAPTGQGRSPSSRTAAPRSFGISSTTRRTRRSGTRFRTRTLTATPTRTFRRSEAR